MSKESTPQERLFEVYEPYRLARANRAADWKDATTVAEADSIQNNLDRLETAYLTAAEGALAATGAEVETAYRDAKEARENVEKAYGEAKKLAQRIKAVGTAGSAAAKLVAKASGSSSE